MRTKADRRQVRTAIRVCQILEATDRWTVTSTILDELAKMGADKAVRATTLKLLHALKKRGVVDSLGTGKIKWILKNKAWDRDNPFNTTSSSNADYVDTTDTSTTGSTTMPYEGLKAFRNEERSRWEIPAGPRSYNARNELRADGWSWDPDRKVRYLPLNATETANICGGKGLRFDLDTSALDQLNHANGSNVAHAEPTDNAALLRLAAKVRELESKIVDLEDTAERACRHIEIKSEGVVVQLTDVVLPKVFDRVLKLAAARRNIMLVGPAGCGKTYLGKLVAKSLGLDFGSLSCTSGMSEAALVGRSIPDFKNGKAQFIGTDFLRCYEEGGVFLMDEIDAADPNLLLAINSAIANGYCNVPHRAEKPTAQRHKDFVIIASANTFGRGANRMYAGRNQLDEATLDRFRIGMVECDYDPTVEAAVCPDKELRTACQAIRDRIRDAGLRRIMSTRFMEDAYIMLKQAEWTVAEILNVFFEGWTPEETAKVRR